MKHTTRQSRKNRREETMFTTSGPRAVNSCQAVSYCYVMDDAFCTVGHGPVIARDNSIDWGRVFRQVTAILVGILITIAALAFFDLIGFGSYLFTVEGLSYYFHDSPCGFICCQLAAGSFTAWRFGAPIAREIWKD